MPPCSRARQSTLPLLNQFEMSFLWLVDDEVVFGDFFGQNFWKMDSRQWDIAGRPEKLIVTMQAVELADA